MRLYLSSIGLGYSKLLINLVTNSALGSEPTKLNSMEATVIINAIGCMDDDMRATVLEDTISHLKWIGFQSKELDLRNYFHQENKYEKLMSALATSCLVWVTGGDTFTLRNAMYASEFDRVICDLLAKDALVYGGYSAGSVVLCPSLRGLESVDNPKNMPQGYPQTIQWDGLNILPYAIAPHYGNPAIEPLVQYYIQNRISFQPLHDSNVIIRNGSQDFLISYNGIEPLE